jgi:hypothetical protein
MTMMVLQKRKKYQEKLREGGFQGDFRTFTVN